MGATSVGAISLNMVLNSSGFRKSLAGAQNQANAASSKIVASFKKIGTAVAVAFSAKMIASFGKECIAAASIQTEAETKLTTVMKQRMKSTDESIQKIKDYASAQQELGVVGDEVQLSGAQQLSTFLQTEDALKTLIPAMNNLAVQQNGVNVGSSDMVNIGNLMGKVMQGQTSALTRVGVTFTEAQEQILKYGDEQQRAATLAQVITDNVGKMNQAVANTPAGKVQQLKNSFGDMMETLGRGLQNVFAPMLTYINKAIAKISQLATAFEALTAKIFGDSNKTAVATSGVANSISEAVDNQENLTEVTEETKKSLAGFDKLNVIGSPKADSGTANGAGSNSVAGAPAAIANNADNTASGMADKFKEQFKNLYEKSGFKDFLDNIKKGIGKVNFKAIKDNCLKIFKELKPIAKTYLDGVLKVFKSYFGAVGSAIGLVTVVWGKGFETLSGGIAKWLGKDSGKIQNFITTISDNFSKGFDNISGFYDNLSNVVGDSIDRMRPVMEESIANLLSGITDLVGGIVEVISGAFSTATQALLEWVEKDGPVIGEFFDNMQTIVSDTFSFVGDVFSDIGTTLSNWWNGNGQPIFKNVCDMFTNIGTTLMNVWNEWIMPVWKFIVDVANDAWKNCLQPIFERAIDFIGKVSDCIATIWNNFLSPVVNWIVKTMGSKITNVLNAVKGIFNTVFGVIKDVIGGVLKTFGGLIDFITGVFSGNWEKAWNGIKDFFKGIWEAIYGVVKGFVNLIIDGINLLWTGIYNAVSGIVNAVGGIAGALGSLFGQNWSFSMPDTPPLIPKLAKGGIVKAPTLAVVGDNAGANSGNPEVIAPLNKLQGMINNSSGEEVVILTQILNYLKRIYEMFVIFKNNGGNSYEFIATLNGHTLFKEFVQEINLYKLRHNGALPF